MLAASGSGFRHARSWQPSTLLVVCSESLIINTIPSIARFWCKGSSGQSATLPVLQILHSEGQRGRTAAAAPMHSSLPSLPAGHGLNLQA